VVVSINAWIGATFAWVTLKRPLFKGVTNEPSSAALLKVERIRALLLVIRCHPRLDVWPLIGSARLRSEVDFGIGRILLCALARQTSMIVRA
jgi:hypothetical protein